MNIFIAEITGNTATLTPEESWHCAKVLRKKAGDVLQLIDGRGNFFEGVLDLVNEKKCQVTLTKGPDLQVKRNYFLHLAIAPTKQMDRIEWMIEKAVEIGVDEISFICCKNSERTVIKTDRARKIVESAVKQSLQALIPRVNEILDFSSLVNSVKCDQKFIAHCFNETKTPIKTIEFRNKSSLVLIGPEGDFTPAEVKLAREAGFEGLELGANRLRTETAGLYVCQAASILSLD